MKKILKWVLLTVICLNVIGATTASAAEPAKFGTVKTVKVVMSKKQIEKKVKIATVINTLTNNKAVDGAISGLIGRLAADSAKSAGLYGFVGGATLMGINKLTGTEKKLFADRLKLVQKKKAKGIVIKTKFKYSQSFDVGDSSYQGYWIQQGKAKIGTY